MRPCRRRSGEDVAEGVATTRSGPAPDDSAHAGGQAEDRPEQIESIGDGKLRRLFNYGRKVYGLDKLLGRVQDTRRSPEFPPELIALIVFVCGLLRVRSFNALEPRLSEPNFLHLLLPSIQTSQLCSADTIGRALRVADIESTRQVLIDMMSKAERNKVFREGWIGALRYLALDGWEPISSYNRHCACCLQRTVTKKLDSGEVAEVTQYYHRYVVAMLIDGRLDLVVDFEPILPADFREGSQRGKKDEGELTAAKRLLARVKKTFGWLDVVVGDGLYANGPFLTLVSELNMGAVIVAKNNGHEPLKEALNIWGDDPPVKVVQDEDKKERIELWDCRDLETLDSYKGKVRVVRGRVHKAGRDRPSNWCALVIGCATRLTPHQVVRAVRGRWHIENTGFHQWTTCWKFTHVFVHDAHGIQALYWLFFAAYNLLTLFMYRQLKSYGRDRGKDVTRTISRLIDVMRDDLARLTFSVWDPG